MSENEVLDFRGLGFGCLFALSLKHSSITLLILTSNLEFAACSLQVSQFQLFPQVYLVFGISWSRISSPKPSKIQANDLEYPTVPPSFPAQLLCRIGARIPTSLWMMLGESFGSQVIGGLLIMVNQSNIHICSRFRVPPPPPLPWSWS